MARLGLAVSYDGTAFRGSQRQAGQRTVQGELESAFTRFWRTPTAIVLAGRTDRGVHAAGQVASLDNARPDLDSRAVFHAVNLQLPDDLRVTRVWNAPDGFHARFDARWREYRFRILFGAPAPLARNRIWERRARVDLAAMRDAAHRMVGTHDFSSFAGGGEGVPWSDRQSRPRGAVRTVFVSEIRELDPWWGPANADERLIEHRVIADGFLPRMVRTMASVIVDIGRGVRPVCWVDELLAGQDRRFAGATAPATGLTLWRVGYSPWGFENTADANLPGLAADVKNETIEEL